MADSIRITIEADDATAAGITSAIANIGKLDKAAIQATGKQGGTSGGGAGVAGMGGAFKTLNGALGMIGLPAIGAAAALGGIVAVTKSAINESAKYNEQVRDLSLVTNTGAEKTSRMLQVLDDFQLGAEDVTIATKALTKQGLVPTVETLAQLSEQYLKINDAQAQNEFILKNLGKGGLQWVNFLKQGKTAILEMNGEVASNLILTDEQIKAYEQYRLRIDQVSDSLQGAKVSVGNFFFDQVDQIGAGVDKAKAIRQYMDTDPFRTTYNQLGRGSAGDARIKQVELMYEQAQAAGISFKDMKAPLDSATMSYIAMAKAVQTGNAVFQEASYNYADLLKGATTLTKSQSDFSDKAKKVEDFFADKANARAAYKQDMNDIKQQFKDGALSLREYNQAVLEQQQAWEKGTFISKAQKEATRQLAEEQGQQGANFLSSILEQKGASDELKYSYAAASKQISSGAAEQYKNISKIADAFMQGKATAEQAAAAARAVSGDLAALSGMTVSAYVDLYIRTHGSMDISLLNPNRGNQRVGGEQLANGGWLTGNNWVIVGDTPGGLTPYSEAISPEGRVYNAKETRWLIANGFIDPEATKRAAMGLDDGGGQAVPFSAGSAMRNLKKRNTSLTSLRGGSYGGYGSAGDTLPMDATVKAMLDTAQSLNMAVTKLMQDRQTTQTMDISSMSQRGLAKNIGAELAKVITPI